MASQCAPTATGAAFLRHPAEHRTGRAEAFVSDLRSAVEHAKQPNLGSARSGALYGLGGTAEGNEILDTLFASALDAMYEVAPSSAGR